MIRFPVAVDIPSHYFTKPADVVVYRDGPNAVAVNRKGEKIAESTYHGRVINDALNSVSEHGGLVFIDAGEYEVDEPIDLGGLYGVHVVGAAHSVESVLGKGFRGTLLRAAVGLNDYVIKKIETSADRYGVVIENIGIHGNRDNQSAGGGIKIQNVKELVIKNVQVWYAYGWGFEIRDCEQSYFENIKAWHSGQGVLLLTPGSTIVNVRAGKSYDGVGIYVGSVTDVVIVNPNADYAKYEGIKIDGGDRIKIIGGFTEYNGTHGLHLLNSKRVTVVGLTSRNNQLQGILLNNSLYNVVAGNHIYDDQATKTQDYGIYEAGSSDYNVIVGNTIGPHAVGYKNIIGANTIYVNNIEY